MILIRYNEIALKGGNRSRFEERLAVNVRKMVRRALGGTEEVEVSRRHGRVFLHTPCTDAVQEALGRTFGLSNYSPVRSVATGLDALGAAVLEEMALHVRESGLPRSFRVLVKRSDKVLDMSSMDVARILGSRVREAYPGLAVDLDHAELTIGVELRSVASYVWVRKFEGRGGLPVGTSGRVLVLISGGLDSPVAAIQALKRGARAGFIHFSGAPFVEPAALEKVEDLCRAINRFQPDPGSLFVVPFGPLQKRIALETTARLRTVIYRRMMVRIAQALATRIHAQALVTGESIGQVASQTLENLGAIDRVATELPILRPVIACDKSEIIAQAQAWGTYDISVRPALDCCTLFADRHPSTRASLETLEAEEARFPVQELVDEALAGIKRYYP